MSYKGTENIQYSKILWRKIEILKRSMIIQMEHGSMLLALACDLFGVDLHIILYFACYRPVFNSPTIRQGSGHVDSSHQNMSFDIIPQQNQIKRKLNLQMKSK
ncbi:Hypothetical_protein [Hexamita inflata]|uniref:Hypothetical_protein n=1 Tax=Hexamita inflata TaxID=28002 RepID=A0AA86VTH9_9EUKA|nr:Hypothetical protein HINF_LOCUS65028 [Hexamita inflata]